MRTIRTKVYKFDELTTQGKEEAKRRWYEGEEYEFLCEDLKESCKELLTQNGAQYSNLSLLYSLSYSQGDGLCFTGQISKGGNTLTLTHTYRYYFAKSVNMEFTDEQGEVLDECKELEDIYFSVCANLEKEGYSILEYRMNDSEFSEMCEANDYEFYANGKLI